MVCCRLKPFLGSCFAVPPALDVVRHSRRFTRYLHSTGMLHTRPSQCASEELVDMQVVGYGGLSLRRRSRILYMCSQSERFTPVVFLLTNVRQRRTLCSSAHWLISTYIYIHTNTPSSDSASVLDLLFGSRYGTSPIPTARCPNRSPKPS